MRTYRERLRSQSGMALVGVMLLLILASGVCAALAVSGKTETMAAYNLDTHAQARAAAEVLLEYLENTALDVKPAMTAVLVGPDGDASTLGDNGSLWTIDVDGDGTATQTGLPNPGTKVLLNNITGVSYEVVALDDDNWSARGGTAGSSDSIGEVPPSGLPPYPAYDDYNRRLVVRAVGHGRNNTTVTLEGIISRPQLGGIVVGADFKQNGTAGSITGEGAGIHANRNLIFSGSPTVAGPVSATGTITGAPAGYTSLLAGQDLIEIPPINASDFEKYADWKLTSTGDVLKRDAFGAWDPTPVCSNNCTLAAQGGADFSAAPSAKWQFEPTASGRYYVEAKAESGGDLTNVSIYATGDILMNSGHDLTGYGYPTSKTVALVSDGLIRLFGNQNINGSIYAREAVDFGGNINIIGQVVAENRSDPAYVNTFNGTVNITWNGDTMIGSFGVSSWREVK
jgi:hypothetical protein